MAGNRGRFAPLRPLMLGDSITAEATPSSWRGAFVRPLDHVRNKPSPPRSTPASRYLFLAELESTRRLANVRARTLMIGFATLSPSDL